MTRALALLGALAVLLSACGGDGAPVRIELRAELSALPPGADPDQTVQSLADTIERRLREYGVASLRIERPAPDRLSVRLRGISPHEALRLVLVTGTLQFRQPRLSVDRQIMCQAPGGAQFTATPLQVTVSTTSEARRVAQCASPYGGAGEVLWEPAAAADSRGGVTPLTGTLLEPGGASVLTDPQPAVAIQLTGEGALLFEQITARLVGFPLGIFLDEQLLAAPNVAQPITAGNAVVTGLDAQEARVLAAQLNGGALPLPVRIAP